MSLTSNKSNLMRKLHKSKTTDEQITIFSEIINLIDENNKLKVTIRDLEHQIAVSKLNYNNLQDKYEDILKKIKNISMDNIETTFQCACDEKNCLKLDGQDCCGNLACCEESLSDYERDQFWNSRQDSDSDEDSDSDKHI